MNCTFKRRVPLSSNLSKEIKRLDDLLRKVVRKEEVYYVCKRVGSDVAHLFVRSRLATRWDRRNCHLLCRECHSESHGGEDVYTREFISKEGQEAYDALRLDSNQMVGNVRLFMEETERMLNENSY